MGQVADAMLSGELCASCGEWLEKDEPTGYACLCEDCTEECDTKGVVHDVPLLGWKVVPEGTNQLWDIHPNSKPGHQQTGLIVYGLFVHDDFVITHWK